MMVTMVTVTLRKAKTQLPELMRDSTTSGILSG